MKLNFFQKFPLLFVFFSLPFLLGGKTPPSSQEQPIEALRRLTTTTTLGHRLRTRCFTPDGVANMLQGAMRNPIVNSVTVERDGAATITWTFER